MSEPSSHTHSGERRAHRHETTIIVNAQEMAVTTKEITFAQVTDVASWVSSLIGATSMIPAPSAAMTHSGR